mgnify:CR=1 FL=1
MAGLTVTALVPAQGPSQAGGRGPATLELPFEAVMDGQPVRCGSIHAGQGSDRMKVTFSDLRLYVSAFHWIDPQGRAHRLSLVPDGQWQQADVALLDFEDGSASCANGTRATNTRVRLRRPQGGWPADMQALSFEVGVPWRQNHQDATLAAAPLQSSAMFWSWQGGYRFLKLELDVKTAQGMEGFPVHLGSTGCASTSMRTPPKTCAQPNRVTVRLAGSDWLHQQVRIDLSALLRETRLGEQAPDTAPGCMSAPDDPDCHGVLKALGLRSGAVQRVFSAVPRPGHAPAP